MEAKPTASPVCPKIFSPASGKTESVPVKLRIDTPIEIDYYRHGGILPFVLRELLTTTR